MEKVPTEARVRSWPGLTERMRIGLLLAATVLVYANTLGNDFVWDDYIYILNNSSVLQPTAHGFFSPEKRANMIRPFTFATFAMDWAIHGRNPFGFHLVNLLLNAAVALLLYGLLRMLLEPWEDARTVALAAAWLFAVHPIHTEAVASIAARSELLGAGFLLGAWMLHLKDREAWATVCLLLAMMSKESAAVFVGMAVVGDYARGRWKPAWRYARMFAVTLLYIGTFWMLKGGHLGLLRIRRIENALYPLPVGWRILNALRVAWKYVGLQLYPVHLSCDYSLNAIRIYQDWRHVLPAAVAAAAVLGAWLWAVWKKKTGWVLAGGIYFGGFATTANILVPTGTIMGERLAYLPSAGFCLLVALLWNRVRIRSRELAWGMLAVMIALLGMRTMARNRDWKDNLTLYMAAEQVVPQSLTVHMGLGSIYLDQGKPEQAEREFRKMLMEDPNDPNALRILAEMEYRKGNYLAAGGMLEKALFFSNREDPNYHLVAVELAVVLRETKHEEEALNLLNETISKAPGYSAAWSNRAVIFSNRGEIAKARADAETALRLDPGNVLARELMRKLAASGSSVFVH